MDISSLLPRPLNPDSHSEAATLLHGLVMRSHFERRTARRFGWRGVKPSFAQQPAWTFRVSRSPLVFGAVFTGESCEKGLVSGNFSLYAFSDGEPHAGMSALAQDLARSPAFEEKVRELSRHADELEPFLLGTLELIVPADGKGLALTLCAKVSRDVRGDDARLACRQRPLRMLMPAFAVLVTSLRDALGEDGELVLALENVPGENWIGGAWSDDFQRAEKLACVTAAFGSFAGRLPGRRLKALHFAHKPHEEELRSKPVMHVVTGFLGSGKTTFLRQWLDYLHNRERYTAVVQNEFGEVDLDSLVLKGETSVEAIDDGCVCCSLSDGLRPALQRLSKSVPAEQFILETTGVASPSNVMGELLAINDMVSRGLLITVVDAYDLDAHPERLEEDSCRLDQIANADVLVLNKADAVEDEGIQKLAARLAAVNPDALAMPAEHGKVSFAALDALYYDKLDRENGNLVSRQARTAARGLFSGGGRWRPGAKDASAEAFESFAIFYDKPVTIEAVRQAVADAGPGVRRAKGVVTIEGEGPSLVQYAAGILGYSPAGENLRRAMGAARDFLVVIGKDLVRPAG
ncbi:MAG: GTP-binding protein [Duodenibacillus sp.]|nr:GTP-binding protein [Duodenibacillus sp.]